MVAELRRLVRFVSYRGAILLLLPGVLVPGFQIAAAQQEQPYFVTYSSLLEEPGNLEIENQNVAAAPKNANAFFAPTLEFEYGATAWWTAEVYLQGQATQNDSAVFTGYRLESRFRPLPREYWINPVLYIEYEDVNAADKSFLEITGNSSITNLEVPNAVLRREVERSMEGKLILSSNVKGWNLSENFIAEKEVTGTDPWEFGYALGASRPLTFVGSGQPCVFCRQSLALGVEMFGGLGTSQSFGVGQTQQYLAPTVAMNVPHDLTFKFSPEFGLNDNSAGVLWRFGVTYEIQQFRDWFRRTK